jgi:hypothetical protein
MALSDERQRIMPTMEDREHGQPLAYPEAVLLTDPSDPKLRGEVPLNPLLYVNNNNNNLFLALP